MHQRPLGRTGIISENTSSSSEHQNSKKRRRKKRRGVKGTGKIGPEGKLPPIRGSQTALVSNSKTDISIQTAWSDKSDLLESV